MRGLVVGYGSIGQRHARLLAGLGLDTAVVSRRTVDADTVYPFIAEAVNGHAPDYVVIASRTNEHRSDLAALAEAGHAGNVLVEKPLFNVGAEVPNNAFSGLFVGYNLRFHPLIQRLKEALEDTLVYAVHAYVGHNLAEWRPGSDYRKGYSASKVEGGGVLRDLSHELDYLNWMLGGWQRLTAEGGRYSSLEIDSDDVFSILFKARRCPLVSLQMNYLDTTAHREIVALTGKGSVRVDLVAGTFECDGETSSLDVERDASLIAQHKAVLAGESRVLCSLEEGRDVMRMIAAAEEAAARKMWVER